MEIISRKDALRLGLKRYFTGVPCANGHIAERHVSKWTCCECTRLYKERKRREQGVKPFKPAEPKLQS